MKNINKICFHIGLGLVPDDSFYFKIGSFLKENYDITSCFLCENESVYEKLINNNNDAYFFYNHEYYCFNTNEKDYLISFLVKNIRKDFKELFFTESFVQYNDEEVLRTLKQKALSGIKLISELNYKNFTADIFFDFSGDGLGHNLFRALANISRGKLITFRESLFPDRLALMSNKFGVWEVKMGDDINPSSEELEYISNFKKNYFEKRKVFWGNPRDRDFRFKVNWKGGINKRVQRHKIQSILTRFKRYTNKYIVNLYYNDVKSIYQKKFYYFPLHYPLDSQLVYRGRPFLNQVNFAEILSDFIPYGHYLVVKEHPHARGAIKSSQIKRLKKIKNVILLHPWINSHDIIPLAEGVIVINSTVALEALYYGKNVYSFGKNYLQNQGLVHEIDEYYDLYDFLKREKFTEEYIRNNFDLFLLKALRSSCPISSQTLFKQILNENQMKTLINSLISFVQEHDD